MELPPPAGELPLAQTIVEMEHHRGNQADGQSQGGTEERVAKTSEWTAWRKHHPWTHGRQETTQCNDRADQAREGSHDACCLKEWLGEPHLMIPVLHPRRRTVPTLTTDLKPLLTVERPLFPQEKPEPEALKGDGEDGNGEKDQQPADRTA